MRVHFLPLLASNVTNWEAGEQRELANTKESWHVGGKRGEVSRLGGCCSGPGCWSNSENREVWLKAFVSNHISRRLWLGAVAADDVQGAFFAGLFQVERTTWSWAMRRENCWLLLVSLRWLGSGGWRGFLIVGRLLILLATAADSLQSAISKCLPQMAGGVIWI